MSVINSADATAPAKVIEDRQHYQWRTGTTVTTITDAATWFLATCQGQRKSPHTIKSYRTAINTVGAILAQLEGAPADQLPVSLLNRNDLGDAFNEYAATHAASSQQHAWTVWNNLCQLLVDHEMMARNPMVRVVSARGAVKQSIPKSLPADAVSALLTTLARPEPADAPPHRRRWRERNYAMVLLLLATGMRESELCGANIGDVNSPLDASGARSILIRGKGNKERIGTFEKAVADALEAYLESRWTRLPNTGKRADDPWKHWPLEAPLFVTVDGERITPRTLYYVVQKAYEEAGITGHRVSGALVHQLRHTMATMLAEDPEVTPYQLKQILGHASLSSTERYTQGAGRATRTASSRNPLYKMVGSS